MGFTKCKYWVTESFFMSLMTLQDLGTSLHKHLDRLDAFPRMELDSLGVFCFAWIGHVDEATQLFVLQWIPK